MVISQLEAWIGGLCLSRCSEGELARVAAEANQAQRLIEGLLTQLAAEASGREAQGRGPVAEEVVQAGGAISSRRAKQLTARAALAQVLPALGAAIEAGVARPENADRVAAVTARGLSTGERERLASADAEITERATNLPPETFAKFLANKMSAMADPPTDSPSLAEQQRAASWFDLRRHRDGMWRLDGELDDERGALVHDVIGRHARRLANERAAAPATANGDRTASTIGRAANDRATALVNAINRPSGPGADSARLGIGYIIDAHTLADGPHRASVAQSWGGEDLDPERVRRLACDTNRYEIAIASDGSVGRVRHTGRSATRHQRLALRALYDSCPLDGATPFDRCEIHHVNVFYRDGGRTEVDNLLPVSPAWHHRIHDRGWTLKMAADRSLRLWRPDGTPDRTIPPPTPLTQRNNRPRAPT